MRIVLRNKKDLLPQFQQLKMGDVFHHPNEPENLFMKVELVTISGTDEDSNAVDMTEGSLVKFNSDDRVEIINVELHQIS